MAIRGEETRAKILDAAKQLVMDRGFSGTSIDEIIKGTGLTKGAFFHHFSSKSDLAEALLTQYAEDDVNLFIGHSEKAKTLSDDPLEQALMFIKMFETYLEELEEPFPGCMFASYIYEGEQFDPTVRKFIETSLKAWEQIYEERFDAVLVKYQPKLRITAKQLAETFVCLLEGAFLVARSRNDTGLIIRQSRQFRKYLEFLFYD
ncbi:MAG: TetR/AcrR family transcriptional regulator [Alphaproteobacteria bacterium]|jgi:TetR/AcrR family transcriptional repressor of nem operon